MNKEEAEEILKIIQKEHLDYAMKHYSNYENIKDETFHRIRQQYISISDILHQYLKDCAGALFKDR